jgi:hypothetical protein
MPMPPYIRYCSLKMADGYIYCLSNPSIPGLLKIGTTTRTPEERARELFTTGVATPFKVEFSRRTENSLKKEKGIHKVLDHYRIPSREFFAISVEEAARVIDTYLSENIPVFLTVEDVLRSEDVSTVDKKRMVACLKKNISYQELKDYYDSLTGDEKESFYNSMFNVWEETQKFIENTTITWRNDKTLVYKVNSDRSIEYIRSVKTSDYHHIRIRSESE